MDLENYTIKHKNNTLTLFKKEHILYSSAWFMEFGKFCADVFDKDQNILYTITKQFQFWKWKMVYHIKENNALLTQLISQNNKKTILSVDFSDITYEVKIHYKKKISIKKNNEKIAEFDESISKEACNLLLLDKKDLEICFVLYSCLKIGDNNQKTMLKSQKELEINEDPWA